MGLFYALKQASQGHFENAFNGLFSSDDLLAAQDAAGDNLSRIVQRQYAEGLINADEQQHLYSLMAPNTDSDQYWSADGDTPLQVFNQTIEERAAAIGQFGSNAINRTLGLGFKIIPWQVYVLLLVLVLIWLAPIWKPVAGSFLGRKFGAVAK